MTRAALAIAVVLAACDRPSPPAPSVAREPARTLRPITTAAAPTRFVGVLTSAELADIGPRVAGTIAEVRVRTGDIVTEGEIVAELDPTPLEAELRAAEASVAASAAATRAASIDLEDARRRFEVETRAVADGVSPAQTLEDARYALKRAEAALQRARSVQAAESARAQSARDQLAAVHLRAPFAGVVTARHLDAGNRVDAGTPIVRIEARGGTRLRFAVPPQDVPRVAPSTQLVVTVETVAVPLKAVVQQVSSTVDPASGMIYVEAELTPTSALNEQPSGLAAWVSL